ncbi:PD-(D/E)XK nuclease family protein [Candidatus Bathyarchaeota archaeon]|nr:PD-(D/E)XK nuclease family protein [Candidatus Bathyarchaeota archaeon]
MTALNRLEELGIERIGVTKLCSQLWCEMQTELDLRYGKPRTEAMIQGGDRHRELHEEIAEVVLVKPRTLADRAALMFQNMVNGITQLLREGVTRELPLIGVISPLKILGQIDELVLQDNKVFIKDYKTRQTPKFPSFWQQRCEEMQLMFYHQLLTDITCKHFCLDDALTVFNLDSNDSISNEFHSTISKKGLKLHSPNVSNIGKLAFSLITSLPSISDKFEIVYEHQETKKYIGKHEFMLNPDLFSRDLKFILEYWKGEREAKPVSEKNRWKCKFCEHVSKCPLWASQEK